MSVVCEDEEQHHNGIWHLASGIWHLASQPQRGGMNRQRGFTLIEISIVLVIIGLLVGGVMAGRELLNVYQSRVMIGEFEKFEAAYRTYRLKYDCVPGDCTKADQFGFSENNQAGISPNGNGFIDGLTTSALVTSLHGEEQTFWSQLSEAKLIPYDLTAVTQAAHLSITGNGTIDGTRRYVPESRIKAGHFYYAASFGGQTYIRNGMSLLGDSSASYSPVFYGASFTVHQARYVIVKAGDGNINVNSVANTGPPVTGKVNIASRNYFLNWNSWYVSPTTASPNTGVTPCAIDTAGVYTWSNANTAACNIFWRVD